MNIRSVVPYVGAALLAGAVSAAAQPATLTNAELQVRSAATGLRPALEALERSRGVSEWVGWDVPARGDSEMCCWTDTSEGSCRGCRLEGEHGYAKTSIETQRSTAPVVLESAPRLLVLLHLASGTVDRVRPFSASCAIDAGGARVHWLTDARPADSVAVLADLVPAGDPDRPARRVGDGALAAIAQHSDPAAVAALERFLTPERPLWARKQAAFWMGQTGDARALDALVRLARQDADPKLRQHLTFVLSQSAEPQALDALIAMAKQDGSRKVRGQALFWLGQKAGKKAIAAIQDAIRDDPDTDIKKKAVFALSQLPKDEGVPLLIQTARTNRNPEVRKQAMFWLGQSEDPRALAFFEEVLTR